MLRISSQKSAAVIVREACLSRNRVSLCFTRKRSVSHPGKTGTNINIDEGMQLTVVLG